MARLDDRLSQDLDRAAAPADPTGVYEHLIRRKERRRLAHRARSAVLVVVVIAGSIAGFYGLTRIFATRSSDVAGAPTGATGTTGVTGPTSAPSGPVAENLPGVGPVCGLTSVEGDFLGNGETGTAYVFTAADDAGNCPPTGAGEHVLGVDLGSSKVEVTTSPLECGLGECSAFAAPDVDADGRAEIAVRVPSSGVPWDFVFLYRAASACPPAADCVPGLEQIVVEEPAAPHAGVEPGPIVIPWGSSGSDVFGAECWSTTDGTDPDIPVLVLFHGTPDGAGGWDQRYVELTIDGATARVFDVSRASGEGTDLITRYADAFCGSPIQR